MCYRHRAIPIHPWTPRHMHLGSPYKRPPPSRPLHNPSSPFRCFILPYIPQPIRRHHNNSRHAPHLSREHRWRRATRPALEQPQPNSCNIRTAPSTLTRPVAHESWCQLGRESAANTLLAYQEKRESRQFDHGHNHYITNVRAHIPTASCQFDALALHRRRLRGTARPRQNARRAWPPTTRSRPPPARGNELRRQPFDTRLYQRMHRSRKK